MELFIIIPIAFLLLAAWLSHFFSSRIYRVLLKNNNKNAKLFHVLSFILVFAIIIILVYVFFIKDFSLER